MKHVPTVRALDRVHEKSRTRIKAGCGIVVTATTDEQLFVLESPLALRQREHCQHATQRGVLRQGLISAHSA
jgi:hypothetical protein